MEISGRGSWDLRGSGPVGSGFEEETLFRVSFDRRAWGNSWSRLVLLAFLLTLSISVQSIAAQDSNNTRVDLDAQIYLAAFRSINNGTRVMTAVTYNVTLPKNITDQSVDLVQIVRLRTGSLRRYGLQFNEISLPRGVQVLQRLNRVVLIYRRFKKSPFYDAMSGKAFVAPVVGVLVYNGDDLANFTNYMRSPLPIQTTEGNITVQLQPSRDDQVICALYNNTNYTSSGGDPSAVVNRTASTASSACSFGVLGDFSLLGLPKGRTKNAWKIALGSALGAILLVLLLLLAVFLCIRYRKRSKFAKMESKSDNGETLEHTFVGGSRAPSAASTRTKPVLENDYAS